MAYQNRKFDEKQPIQTDPLTDLPFKTAMEQRLLSICNDNDMTTQAAVISADMDNMKDLNEKGHDVADVVIQSVGFILKKQTENEGIEAYRKYQGGDEFVLIICGKDKQTVIRIAENIRKLIEQATKTTMSFGIAIRQENEIKGVWFKRAEDYLKKAKDLGKNLVVCDDLKILQDDEKAADRDSLFNADSLQHCILSLESLHKRGRYLCSTYSKFDDKRYWSSVVGCNYNEVVNNPSLKFIVHKVDNNTILLESMSRRNWYLMMISNKIKSKTYVGRMAVIEHSYSIPLKNKRAQWKIVGDNPDCFSLLSCEYSKHYLDGRWSKSWKITGRARPYTTQEENNEELRQWSKWKICIYEKLQIIPYKKENDNL